MWLPINDNCTDPSRKLVQLKICRVFFKVLSSQSFFKGKWLWVSKSNMADKMSYCSYFPARGSKICQKDSPHQNVFKLTLSQKSFFVFRKDRQCKFKSLLSPNLDLINIISVRALKALDFWTTLPGVLYKTCVKPKEESTLVIPSWNILTEENLTQFENLLAYTL